MHTEQHIFGFRHHSNVSLYPTPAELAEFLAGPKGAAARKQGADLTAYRALIDDVRRAERLSPQDQPEKATERAVFSSVLGHTRFANATLATEVEHYTFFLDALKASDLRKPLVFIRAAEEEMAKLDPKKKKQAALLNRLRELSDARKRDLQGLRRRREALCEELAGIARYVRDNLLKIENLCTTSLVVLSDASLAGQIEQRLVESVKEHFRNYLKENRDRQAIAMTPAYLEALKADVAMLCREIIALRREVAAAAEKLYQALLRHAGNSAREIDAALTRLGERRSEGDAADQMLFTRIEHQLAALVAGWRLEIALPERTTSTPYKDVFKEKKLEALDSLFDLVRGERRAVANRRSGRERRIFNLMYTKVLERRTGSERRSGKDRRAEAAFAY